MSLDTSVYAYMSEHYFERLDFAEYNESQSPIDWRPNFSDADEYPSVDAEAKHLVWEILRRKSEYLQAVNLVRPIVEKAIGLTAYVDSLDANGSDETGEIRKLTCRELNSTNEQITSITKKFHIDGGCLPHPSTDWPVDLKFQLLSNERGRCSRNYPHFESYKLDRDLGFSTPFSCDISALSNTELLCKLDFSLPLEEQLSEIKKEFREHQRDYANQVGYTSKKPASRDILKLPKLLRIIDVLNEFPDAGPLRVKNLIGEELSVHADERNNQGKEIDNDMKAALGWLRSSRFTLILR